VPGVSLYFFGFWSAYDGLQRDVRHVLVEFVAVSECYIRCKRIYIFCAEGTGAICVWSWPSTTSIKGMRSSDWSPQVTCVREEHIGNVLPCQNDYLTRSPTVMLMSLKLLYNFHRSYSGCKFLDQLIFPCHEYHAWRDWRLILHNPWISIFQYSFHPLWKCMWKRLVRITQILWWTLSPPKGQFQVQLSYEIYMLWLWS
jgi:hypothetical protein